MAMTRNEQIQELLDADITMSEIEIRVIQEGQSLEDIKAYYITQGWEFA